MTDLGEGRIELGDKEDADRKTAYSEENNDPCRLLRIEIRTHAPPQ